MSKLEEAVKAIEAQQPQAHDAVWCVGEQLKEILRREPQWAESIAEDLKNPAQTLKAVEQKIAALARKHKSGNVGVVTPMEAEEIIREVYGMAKAEPSPDGETDTSGKKGEILSLEDFL